MQNIRPVTLFLVEFLCFCLVLVSKSVTFAPPLYKELRLHLICLGDQRKRRSLDADLQACVANVQQPPAGGQQDPAASGQKPPGQSLDNSLMDRIRAELKLGPQVQFKNIQ